MKDKTKAALRRAVDTAMGIIVYPALLWEDIKKQVANMRALFMTRRQELEMRVQIWVDSARKELELARQLKVDERYPTRVDQLECEIKRTQALLQDKSTPEMALSDQYLLLLSALTKVNLLVNQAAESQCEQILKELVP